MSTMPPAGYGRMTWMCRFGKSVCAAAGEAASIRVKTKLAIQPDPLAIRRSCDNVARTRPADRQITVRCSRDGLASGRAILRMRVRKGPHGAKRKDVRRIDR